MNRKKENRIILTFESTTQALKTEARCKRYCISGKLIPVPRQLSAGCGMAWSSPVHDRENLMNMLSMEQIEVDGIYEFLM